MIKIKLDQKTINLIESKIDLLDDNLTGVYFLTYNDTVVYVGKSKNIKSRIKTHIQERRKVFSDFYFIKCEKNILNETEVAYIYMHDPIFNKKDSLTDGISTEEFCMQNGICFEQETKLLKSRTLLFNHYEIAERFGIPKPTTANWSKEAKEDKDTWRARHYVELEKIYAKELAEKANSM